MPILFFIVLVIMGSFAMLLPAIIYVLENLGASISASTPVLAAYSLAQFLAGPQWGRLSDRLGRKPMLMAALAVACFAYAGMYLYADTLYKLLFFMVIAGFAAGAMAVVFASVADVTTEENRTKGMGVVGAAIGMAFVAGTAIGGSIAGTTAANASLAPPAAVAASSCLVGLLAVLLFFREPSAHADIPLGKADRLQAFRRIARHPALLKLCVVILVFTSCLALMEPLMPKYVNVHFGWGPVEMRNLFIFIGAVLVVVQGGLVGPISKRFGERNMLKAALIIMIAGLGLLAALPSPELVYVALLLTSVGTACFTASSLSLASREAEAHEKGAVMGVAQSMQALGRFVGPMLAGLLFDVAYWLPFTVGSISVLCLYFVVLRLFRVFQVAA